MRVVYIAGYGRSGSTVADISLGRDRGLSAGELTHLFKAAAEAHFCSCGSTVLNCPVWSPAIAEATSATSLDTAALARVTHKSERYGHVFLPHLKRPYVDAWGAVFNSLHDEGYAIVIDSSKTAWRLRPLLIRRINPMSIIHLQRQTSGVLRSVRNGDNRRLEDGSKALERFPAQRAIAGILFADCVAAWAGHYVDSCRIRSEMLTSDPAGASTQLERQIGLPLQTKTGRQGAHIIAGNRLARSADPSARQIQPGRMAHGQPSRTTRLLDRLRRLR